MVLNHLVTGMILQVAHLGKGKDLSNEKNPGWLGFKGDYTTQFYGDYNKPL